MRVYRSSKNRCFGCSFKGKSHTKSKGIYFLNGTAATRYSGLQTISTQQSGSNYILRGYENNRSIETYNMQNGSTYNNIDFIDNDNNWTALEFHNANKDDAGLEAHWRSMMTWDYFKQVYGRNSYNNNGGTIKNYVNANFVSLQQGFANNANAFWEGGGLNRLTYGNCIVTPLDSYVTLDIMAHEFGHGLCQYTAFGTARTRIIEAATRLYGYNSQEEISVTNAWHAVGIGDRFPVITGPSLLCRGSDVFTATNTPAGYTWTTSSNLTIYSTNGNTAYHTSQ